MTQRFSNAHALKHKQEKLKVWTSWIVFLYDICSRQTKCQNIITSDLKASFIIWICGNYLKHTNLQQFYNDKISWGNKVNDELVQVFFIYFLFCIMSCGTLPHFLCLNKQVTKYKFDTKFFKCWFIIL